MTFLLVCRLGLGILLIGGHPLAASPTEGNFSRLQEVLTRHGFTVKLETPPIRGAYGMFAAKTRTIWIHPIAFDLGIATPTLIHEATHAAQFCYGGKTVRALGLTIPPPPMTRRFFTHYEGYTRQIEAEAYTVQVQPNGTDLAIALLEKHCRISPPAR